MLGRKSKILRLSCQPAPVSQNFLSGSDWKCCCFVLPPPETVQQIAAQCDASSKGYQSAKCALSSFTECFHSNLWCSYKFGILNLSFISCLTHGMGLFATQCCFLTLLPPPVYFSPPTATKVRCRRRAAHEEFHTLPHIISTCPKPTNPMEEVNACKPSRL